MIGDPKLKPLILDFCGAHSTGKTTVMEALQIQIMSHFPKLKVLIVPSVSRTKLAEMNLKLYGNVDNLNKSFISLGNMMEVLHCPAHVILTTDVGFRGLAYSMVGDISSTMLSYQRLILHHFLYHLNLVTLNLAFFYIPIEFPIVKDGVRDEDINYQKRVDDAIQLAYRTFPLTPYQLKGSVEERQNAAMDFILKQLQRMDDRLDRPTSSRRNYYSFPHILQYRHPNFL